MDKYWVTIEDLSINAMSQEDAEEKVWQWLEKILPFVSRDDIIISAYVVTDSDRDVHALAWIT